MDPAEARALEARELGRILGFARNQVPFYGSQEAWARLRLGPSVEREVLCGLPVLRKHHIHENQDALVARRLPAGERVFNRTRSSGTTGRPTTVLFSRQATLAFGFFMQRSYRWARFDPAWTQAIIRLPQDLPRGADGSELQDGATLWNDGWQYIHHWFDTGPMIALSRTSTADAQVEWLRARRPELLVTFPGTLETLVYASQGKPVDSLRGLRSMSATLTEATKNRLESATGLTVTQNYGLNEIGIVAVRCAAGRYHVNAEHCLVEIVDDDGNPCKAGETGRILVTGLTNVAMPLIRYDTGDLGAAVDGECPCGRTLPSFGAVLGRYRPMHHTPDGTAGRVNLIQKAIDELPLEALAGLREYQIHQYRDGRFELRIATRDEDNRLLAEAVQQAWGAQDDDPPPLAVVRVGKVFAAPGGKQQEFTSDFFPPLPKAP